MSTTRRSPKKEKNETEALRGRYNDLVQQVELLDIRLVHSESQLRPVDIPEQIELSTHTPEFRARYSVDESILYCGVRFKLTGGAETKEEAAVTVVGEYSLLYRVPTGIEIHPDIAMLFAARNAMFNAWPFFRELVFSLSSRMGLAPLIIPLYRLPVLPPKLFPEQESSDARGAIGPADASAEVSTGPEQ